MITKEHETKIKEALDILDEVRNDLKELEKDKGLKAPKGNAVRFSIDSVFEDERLGFIYKHGLFEEEENASKGKVLTDAEHNHEKQCQADDEDRHLGFMDAEEVNNDAVNDFMITFDI